MSIRLVNGCVNCQNLTADSICKIHEAKVESIHTCDSFNMRVSLKSEVTCISCIKYFSNKCPNQAKAAPAMLGLQKFIHNIKSNLKKLLFYFTLTLILYL